MQYSKIKAFTLVEILVWILIVSIILVAWFSSYIRIWYWKINLIEQTDMQKNAFYFSERLYQLVKEWGVIDYEEYFNRKALWTWTSSWYYLEKTWFWNYWYFWELWTENFGDSYYYCISKDWTSLSMDLDRLKEYWCLNDFNIAWNNLEEISSSQINANYVWSQQRYWEYSFQFIDYNSNADDDSWDENWDRNILWDDDDEYMWIWPSVFWTWEAASELYLISWDKKTRTFLRWNVKQDPDAPVNLICQNNRESILEENNFTESCIWTIEFIKLVWEDWWLDHKMDTKDFWEYDWVIDTWLLDSQFSDWEEIVAWTKDMENYWKPLFPSSINVTDFKIFVYPNIDYNHAWRETSEDSFVSPYVTISYKIKPSWQTRKRIKTEWKELIINTTVNLTDIFSK